MLSLEQIAKRKDEITRAKGGFEQQLAKFERDAAAVRTRLANIAGALELIEMFEQDAENAKSAEQLADEQAEAELPGETTPLSEAA